MPRIYDLWDKGKDPDPLHIPHNIVDYVANRCNLDLRTKGQETPLRINLRLSPISLLPTQPGLLNRKICYVLLAFVSRPDGLIEAGGTDSYKNLYGIR